MTDTTNLPPIVRTFLTAQGNDHTAALAAFADGATVTDEGTTRRGRAEIHDWLQNAASEFTYTVELVETRRVDDDHWIATHHLEGDFPGGVVDLDFAFALRDDEIQDLTITPRTGPAGT
ncbi:MAG: nuclear transport factor 2 family protein [Sporichthyaceae bacterium]